MALPDQRLPFFYEIDEKKAEVYMIADAIKDSY